MLTDHLPHPKHCFCNIDMELLRKWFLMRYQECIPTLELMEMAQNDGDREAICAVAMFDIDEQTMLEMMGDVTMPEHHIVHCRAKVQKQLEYESLRKGCSG